MTATFDLLVVGAGFAGATLAERFAAAGRTVLVLESRDHIGGNAFDTLDAQGVLIHPFGPHIFHTNADEVVAYLSRFTAWRPFTHRVLARSQGRLFPIPINRTTLNRVYGLAMSTEAEVAALLERIRTPVASPRTSEEVVLNAVGPELYQRFFRGYTRKQWGRDPGQLDAQVTARIPTRLDEDDRYFTDRFQQMPAEGFAAMFRRMLDHPGIRVELGRRFTVADLPLARHCVYTGPVDQFFACRFGPLPWRSLRFEHQHLPGLARFQEAPVVNEPEETVPYTRTTEFRWLTGQAHSGTSIVREYPQDEGDPYYPIPAPEAKDLHQRYQALAEATPGVTFVGRLAQYRYYNMDQVVAAALTKAKQVLGSDAPA